MFKKFGVFSLLVVILILGGFFTNILSAFAVTANITQINFTTPSRTADINTPSAVLTTQTQNVVSTSEQVSETNYLNLSSSSGTGEFSSNNVTWNSVTTLTMSPNSANRNFYYRDSTPGNHILTVTATGRSWTPATQTITINSPVVTLTSIAIAAPATKLSYTVGDALDITGLVITGTYSDASTSTLPTVITDISGFNSSIATTSQVLTITVDGKTATYTVDIVAIPVVATSTEPVVVIAPQSGGSGGSGYIPGWGPNGQIVGTIAGQVLSATTGKVLGASTVNVQELARQKKLRYLKWRLNHIRIRVYNLKHPQTTLTLVAGQVAGTTTTLIAPAIVKPENSTATASTTFAKPFWKFW